MNSANWGSIWTSVGCTHSLAWLALSDVGHRNRLNSRDVPDIRYYLVSSQESGIWLDLVSSIRFEMISGILYQVESHIQYYPVHNQLLSNTAIRSSILMVFNISCQSNAPWISASVTLNLPDKPYLALSGFIRNPVESVIRYFLESIRIWYPGISGIQWKSVSSTSLLNSTVSKYQKIHFIIFKC